MSGRKREIGVLYAPGGPPEPLPRYVRANDLIDAGIVSNRKLLERWVAAGSFPAPYRFGRNTLAYKYDEVMEWLASREKAIPAA